MARHGPIAETKEETIMIRAATYARYSSEGQRESSIEDQLRTCERRAEREGWTIIQRYADKGISGSKDGDQRPGYKALLTDAKEKRFDVLLVDDLSRLSRDEAELIVTRRKFMFWGVRLIGVSDGFDSDAKGHKIQATVRGLMNEIYLDDLKEKTHRGLAGQALKGYNCGGRTYGYRHIPIHHPTEKDEYGRPRIIGAKREIDEEQARWVRQIFTWYADGKSPRWIAGELNRLGVPGPAATYKRKKRSGRYGTWSSSALHGVVEQHTGLLNNVVYVGKLIWNRREWVRNPETKRKVPKLRPESEWIVTECPDLRIVSDDVWKRVQTRRRAHLDFQGNGKLRAGRGPKYLLSGLLKCGVCESNYVVSSYYQYGCAGYLNRGEAHCANRLRVARTLVEERCLAAIQRDLFTPEALDLFVKETTRLLAERQRQQRPQLAETQKRLVKVEQEVTNIMTAIKEGIRTPTTKLELEKAECERARLQETLQRNSKNMGKLLHFLPNAAERYRKLVENLGNLPERHIAEARQQIKELVAGEIKLIPTAEGYLDAEMRGCYPALLKLAVGMKLKNVVAGEGFEPSTFGLCVPLQLSLPG